MDLTIPEEVDQLRTVARRALSGPAGQRSAFRDGSTTGPDRRAMIDLLGGLGLFDLDVDNSPEEALAAALVVEEVGAAAGAVPIIPRLLSVTTRREGLLHPIGAPASDLLLNHLDLDLESEAIGPDGAVYSVRALESPQFGKRPMVPYAARVYVRPTGDTVSASLWDLGNILTAFFAVGGVRAAIDLACSHVKTRHQFGQYLASFQGIRNHIADAVIAERGLTELALYTLWRYHAEPASRRVDATMLRYHQLVTTRTIFANVHQLHAAVGFCYEYPLLQHSLGLQFDRQVPLNESGCLALLRNRFREVETNYDQLAPAWPLIRTDAVAVEPAFVVAK